MIDIRTPYESVPTVVIVLASLAAVLDGSSTVIALGNGAVELNPLLGPNPQPWLVMSITLAKVLVVCLVQMLAPRVFALAFLWGAVVVWGGAAVNNFLVALGLMDPVPVLVAFAFSALFLRWLDPVITVRLRLSRAAQSPSRDER